MNDSFVSPDSGNQNAEPAAAFHQQLWQPEAASPSEQISVQRTGYGLPGAPDLQELLIQGLLNGSTSSQGINDNAQLLCEQRHMTNNECYDFKRLAPNDQDQYDRLRSNREREDFLFDHR